MTGKVVLITGSSRGIGRETAVLFSAAGARVAVHYRRNLAEAEVTMSRLEGQGHMMFQADLSETHQAEALAGAVVSEMGCIDVLVNNAGIFEEHPIPEATFDTWRDAWTRTLNINLLSPANLCYWTAQHMIERGGGRIVNVSSRGAFRGEPDAPAYGASKAGLNAMSQSLAKALAPYGIFVCVVAPGFVETDMAASSLDGPEGDAIRAQSPLNRVATAEEVARAVLFLASEGTEFMTGCIVDVNGASYLRS
jgi:NAD(P)-dependent dehydrogenase (short-subunit alcohol dehydrogenase family)